MLCQQLTFQGQSQSFGFSSAYQRVRRRLGRLIRVAFSVTSPYRPIPLVALFLLLSSSQNEAGDPPALPLPLFVAPVQEAAAPAESDPKDEKSGVDEPQPERPHFEDVSTRWYDDPWNLLPGPPYEINEPGSALNPYRQHVLKGDFPILDTKDIFLAFTLTDKFTFEFRNVPTPRGITGDRPDNQDFFGNREQYFYTNNLILTADLFKGQQAFKPVDWRVKTSIVFNTNYLKVRETGVLNASVARDLDRQREDFAIQELFVEKHLFDVSDRFDFLSIEAGILPFRSDFRGFIFDDSNLGVRLLGNADNNKWQYNLAYFMMLEKDTNSELNRFNDRDQQILIANLYRQDWPVLGYISQLSLHWNHDEANFHFDRNDILTRPAPIGVATPQEVDAYYLGWSGEGHFGPWNITHSAYYVFGEEEENAIAGRGVNIQSFLLASELSRDFDWLRLRGFVLYASGDHDSRDDLATGFDGIIEAPNFAGGELSLWNRQAIRLLGTNLTQRLSPYADLGTSKIEGQSNFVNPGLLLVGGALDAEVTPTTRAQIGASYLRFDTTDPLETFLQIEDIEHEIGAEVFAGCQYRPFLNNHVIFNFGGAFLVPGTGLEKVYDSEELFWSVFVDAILTF